MLFAPHNQRKGQGTMTYQIYVASLSDYNAGILHGKWIELDRKDTDEILKEIDQILAESPYAKKYGEQAEEWAIHDYELEGIRISEYESLESVTSIVEALKEYGKPFAIYYNDVGDLDDAKTQFEEAYEGEYNSFLEYATWLFDENYGHKLSDPLGRYIDYEAFARDLKAEGYYIEKGHVFRPI